MLQQYRWVGRALAAGWIGGFVGNALLGAAFSSPWAMDILYNPAWQSPLFMEITPTRNIPLSVVGLIVLFGTHGVFYTMFCSAIPGQTWWRKGLFWGLALWGLYWLAQEWFIYVTLLGEPWPLAVFELVILLFGSLSEGLVIARLAPQVR